MLINDRDDVMRGWMVGTMGVRTYASEELPVSPPMAKVLSDGIHGPTSAIQPVTMIRGRHTLI